MKSVFVLFLVTICFVTINAKKRCNCMIPAYKNVINGTETKGAIPWLVAVEHPDHGIVCAGVLVHRNKVLIAASCLDEGEKKLRIIAGVQNLTAYDYRDRYYIDSIKRHEEFSSFKVEDGNDLAIVTLREEVRFENGRIELACLDFEFEKSQKDETLLVTDFGIVDERPYGKTEITRATEFKERDGIENPKFIAAGPIDREKNICNKDLGAPIHRTVGGISRVIGLASYSEGDHDSAGNVRWCSEKSYFTKLQYYKSWFDEELGPTCYFK